MAHETPPRWDRAMRERLREGEAAALAELYDRFASLSYSIAARLVGDGEAAAEVTREVFAGLWESPDRFDPARGPMRSWVAAEAHRLGVARLRERAAGEPEQLAAQVRAASTAARADYIATSMPAPLRDALALTRFQRLSYGEVAERLGIAEDEARRRLRLGLQLLATAAGYGGTGESRGSGRAEEAPTMTPPSAVAAPPPAAFTGPPVVTCGPEPGAPGAPGAPGTLRRDGGEGE
ncbi:RNA polymerase sigma factor [Streptomyces aidingensis]|uniref:RNA polymerase sigma-70 factor, ECF subfamily n=1 Tax=Streptomyces aidingensis TaxID=910347 RepID=A0A1I1HAG6_9ACTN|nr:sigma-70 family RNA polymerase sigma factor [Streptomyces aidingensis]SFC20766.1 RNA polymerase sigma-70 factor, ECF subfamily [Streptomyces aidingensis]